MPARVKKRLVPPEEMKGSGIPLVGRSESTTLMLKKACSRMAVVMSEGGEARERIGGAEGGAQAAISEHDEEDEDEHGAEEAEFFSDVGVDEIGGRFGEVEELLHALHVAAAHEAAGADGDEGLVDVEACALRVEVGVQEGQHARRGATGPRRAARRAAGAAAATARTRYFHSMPARRSIMAVTPPTTRAVPRSGCLTISSMKTTGMSAARSRVLSPVAHLCRDAWRGTRRERG